MELQYIREWFLSICFGLLIFGGLSAQTSVSPNRCQSTMLEASLRQRDPGNYDAQKARMQRDIDTWLQNAENNRSDKPELFVPVHVIVIHRPGQAIGSDENISEEQIRSQIAVLNRDFRRRNADTTLTDPSFAAFASDSKIGFCLADTDPDGNPTNGITRFVHDSTEFSAGVIDNTIKLVTSWNADLYLNIWVAHLENGFVGYAYQPPVFPDYYDGVVIDYRAFGDMGTAKIPLNLGRTATHEVGHWLGLEHPWGPGMGGCDLDDGIDDTPLSQGPHTGCAIEGISCGSKDMVGNYMEYVYDACMNIFTRGQTDHMRAVLQTQRLPMYYSGGCSAAVRACPRPLPPIVVPIGPESAFVFWSADTNAILYRFESRPLGKTHWNHIILNGTSATIEHLTPGQTYEIRMAHKCEEPIWSVYSPSVILEMPTVRASSPHITKTESAISLFPNPARNTLTIKVASGFFESGFDRDEIFEIRDVTGRLLMRDLMPRGEKNHVVDLTELPPGMLILCFPKVPQIGYQRLLHL